MGAIATQPHFAPITRRALMTVVNTVARDLGLRATSVIVMDALLSCLPCKDPRSRSERPITPLTLLTVYASNETLCFRARGLTERQLRRQVSILETAGLICRRDSANGKRFPVRRGGQVIGAFGIDLSPLLARSAELVARAERLQQEHEERRGLKARIQSLRAGLLQSEAVDATARNWLEGLRNILRRSCVTLTELQVLLGKLTEMTRENSATELDQNPVATEETTATDGENVRHKERKETDTKKAVDIQPQNPNQWRDLPILSEFFPDAPRSLDDCREIARQAARILGIGEQALNVAARSVGWWTSLCLQDRMAGKIEHIREPDAYFLSLAIPRESASSRSPRNRMTMATP